MFEKSSGKKLLYDADVEIEKEYYLLKRGDIDKHSRSSIRIQKITQKQFGRETWILYIVSASAFNEEAARFYLDFHCRLTDQPVSVQPVWPLFTEGNYIVKHSRNNLYMLVEGNVSEVKTFPPTAVRQLSVNTSQIKLYEISCSDRQQLISAGRIQPLQYTYFWKEPLDQIGGISRNFSNPIFLVLRLFLARTILFHITKTLRFKSDFDGEIIIYNNHRVIEKRKISADTYIELDGISYGLSVQVVIGLDVLWQTDFKKKMSTVGNDEIELLKQITNVTGISIPVPHSLRNILIGMRHYPKICQWIRKCIKNGTINKQSYRRLQDAYHSMNTNK